MLDSYGTVGETRENCMAFGSDDNLFAHTGSSQLRLICKIYSVGHWLSSNKYLAKLDNEAFDDIFGTATLFLI